MDSAPLLLMMKLEHYRNITGALNTPTTACAPPHTTNNKSALHYDTVSFD